MSLALASANVAPTVVIQSATMRPGTTLMDVVFRVNDPDDATVKTRALAFIDGERSFAKLVKPVTFAEGTGSKFGDAIPTNTDHTVTWDVAADWNIQLGQVKFEVLAVDSNGMLPFDGITIPAAAGNPELKINQIGITDEQTFNALLWMYASGNSNMQIASGNLVGSATSGVFKQKPVVVGATLTQQYAQPFLFKLLDITWAGADLLKYADEATRTMFARNKWLTTNRPYVGTQFLYGWGSNDGGQTNIPVLSRDVIAIAAGENFSLALNNDGTVVAWGSGPTTIPQGLSGVTTIAAGSNHCLALKSDGTMIGWGDNGWDKATIPAGLSGVKGIAAGSEHSLALKNDGTVVAWGGFWDGQISVPEGLSGVIAIAAKGNHSMALKSDGTVVSWGSYGGLPAPEGLSDVTAISTSHFHCLALKGDGTVVAWGASNYTTVPEGLSGVTAIAAGDSFNLALKSNGTVVVWGDPANGQTTIPTGLSGVIAIAAGQRYCLALTAKAP